METVLLKSRMPFQARYRPIEDGVPKVYEYHWNLDNDCRQAVSAKWWEENKDVIFDRKDRIRFSDILFPL